MCETALVVEAPDAEPLVGKTRAALDSSAALGMPAHLTILYPFKPAEGLSSTVIATLAELAHRTPELAYQLTAVDEFDDVALWLRPNPTDLFRDLAEAVWTHFPESPPYRGEHVETVPHLTVATERTDAGWHATRRELDRRLPWSCAATALSIFCADQRGRWSLHERLPFGP